MWWKQRNMNKKKKKNKKKRRPHQPTKSALCVQEKYTIMFVVSCFMRVRMCLQNMEASFTQFSVKTN